VGKSLAVLDTGPGALRKMLEADIPFTDITAVHYTHTHVDHVNDMPALLFASKYDEYPRTAPMLVTGPPGFEDFYKRLVNLYGDQILSDNYELTIREISRGELDLAGYKLMARPMKHMIPCTGYRIEDTKGSSVVYTGDTDYCEEVLELAKGADILITESALPPEHELEGHLQPDIAGRIAAEAGVDTLVIAHLYPICDRYDTEKEARKNFSGSLIVSEDLLQLEI
jgi:ribonuclease BN (tRNA processing enzyme)